MAWIAPPAVVLLPSSGTQVGALSLKDLHADAVTPTSATTVDTSRRTVLAIARSAWAVRLNGSSACASGGFFNSERLALPVTAMRAVLCPGIGASDVTGTHVKGSQLA